MAIHAESPAVTPGVQVVGNAFVEQYYHILHQSPELVYRFYQDSSVLSRPDSNGVMSSVMTMQGINEKILSLKYKDYIAEIKTADAQQSFGEGVIVLVTGYLTGRDNVRKKFVQSFFLAPQEKGYFVLNDVFRYLEDDELAEAISASANGISENVQAAPSAPEQEQPSHIPDHPGEVPESSVEEDLNDEPEVCDPSDIEDGSITEEEIVEPPIHLNQRESTTATSAPPATLPQEDAPKQSYASILKAMKASPSPTPAKTPASNVKAKPPSSEQETVGSAKPALAVEASSSTSKSGPGKSNIVEEAEGYSIYVRNLPQNATAAELEEVFSKFGPIKRGGVQVRSNKQGFCFGFVEFESSSSMHSAIEASPVIIGNRKAVVEEKRTTTRVSAAVSSNSGRGRYSSSRDGFRNDNFRGGRGGSYGGGRGFGRNDFRGQGEYSARPRDSAGRGPEGYQRVEQNETGNGVRQGGPK